MTGSEHNREGNSSDRRMHRDWHCPLRPLDQTQSPDRRHRRPARQLTSDLSFGKCVDG
jgi:hypothetical protein